METLDVAAEKKGNWDKWGWPIKSRKNICPWFIIEINKVVWNYLFGISVTGGLDCDSGWYKKKHILILNKHPKPDRHKATTAVNVEAGPTVSFAPFEALII